MSTAVRAVVHVQVYRAWVGEVQFLDLSSGCSYILLVARVKWIKFRIFLQVAKHPKLDLV